MAVRFASQAPTLAASLTTSSLNLGTAIGSSIAGVALETSLGATGPVVVGTAIAALYFLPLGLLVAKEQAVGSLRKSPPPSSCTA
ncbi:hypothetical protein [Archangium lansingense]|uniref:MFS transporter n=1 Tax=Archangium lansingense TaxID=2995310 RepID=A0ABT4AAX3_9BACT|nr:hypothetical protein [Archangium lansinium]MCY1078809.1 hypothetical protein [Archangium lansinium]